MDISEHTVFYSQAELSLTILMEAELRHLRIQFNLQGYRRVQNINEDIQPSLYFNLSVEL